MPPTTLEAAAVAKRGNRRLRELADDTRTERVPRFIPGEEEGPILSRIGFFLGSLLAFLAVAAGAVWFGGRAIERSLEDTTLRFVRTGGYDDVEVIASGRDIRLIGFVPSEDARDIIPPTIIKGVQGVRSVDNDLAIAEEIELDAESVPADPLTIAWSGGTVEIVGTLSSDEVREFVIGRLDVTFPDSVSASGLEVVDGVAPENAWLGDVLRVVAIVATEVDTGSVLVNSEAGVVTVSAELADRQSRADVRRESEEILGAGPLDFVSGFTVEDAPPPPPREQVVELQEDLDDLIAGKVVEFELNSDELTPAGEELLTEIVDALRQFPDVPVEIAGHTDSQGEDAFNLDLSTRRAEAALAFFVAAGETPERFVVVGYGEAQPIADNSTSEGRARNRRIEFIALEE